MTEANETKYWNDEVAAIFGSERWLIAYEHAAAATSKVEYLESIGAEEPFVISGVRGGGALPDIDHLEILGLDAGSGILDTARAFEDALLNLPFPIQVKLDGWDPERKARVLGAFFAAGNPVAGRAFFGGRPESWRALEDKTVIDELWDEIGIARAPSQIVAADAEALEAAHRKLDRGAGTVQVADNREGFNGGASHIRWVRDDDDQADAAEFFDEHAHEVRVMPFLEGVPCSVHGIVFDEYVAALRPMEMVVFRRPDSSKFKYVRAASFWDPTDADRDYMRSAARKVGEHLRETLDYRGAFTIDGVMTDDGFLPTELNPRFGAALGVMLSSENLASTALMMHFALVEGVDADWKPREFEELALQVADANRAGRLGATFEAECEEVEIFVGEDDGEWVEVEEGAHFARVKIDPAGSASRVNVHLNDDVVERGPHVAPKVAEIFAHLDGRFDLGIGALEAAEAVRRS